MATAKPAPPRAIVQRDRGGGVAESSPAATRFGAGLAWPHFLIVSINTSSLSREPVSGGKMMVCLCGAPLRQTFGVSPFGVAAVSASCSRSASGFKL